MLIALAGCENVVAHAVAKEMAFDLQGLTFDISGEFDPRGFMGDPNVRTYFETVTINVKREDNGIRRTFEHYRYRLKIRANIRITHESSWVELAAYIK